MEEERYREREMEGRSGLGDQGTRQTKSQMTDWETRKESFYKFTAKPQNRHGHSRITGECKSTTEQGIHRHFGGPQVRTFHSSPRILASQDCFPSNFHRCVTADDGKRTGILIGGTNTRKSTLHTGLTPEPNPDPLSLMLTVTRCQLLNFSLAASKPKHTESVSSVNSVLAHSARKSSSLSLASFLASKPGKKKWPNTYQR